MVKTKKLTEKECHVVFIRYIKLTEKQEELLKQIDEDFIYKKNEKEQKGQITDQYGFNILEYDNSTGYYNRCYRYILRFEKTKYSKDFVKEYVENILKDEIKCIDWNGNDETEKLGIRLKGDEKKLNTKLSYYNIENRNCSIKYPISILSYGRYNQNKTSKYLLKCKIKHYIFVEECEYNLYIKNYYNKLNDEDKWLVNIINTYNDFHLLNLGGSPVRNYILDYWLKQGVERCWMLDDNINCYKRYNKGLKLKIYSDLIFSSIERYIKEYDNVGICSHNICGFVRSNLNRGVIVLNQKHYSSLLLLTNKQFRFKHKYNEDVLISIDYIISGKINFCFNHILYNKNTSGKDTGGNTNTIYKNGSQEGYRLKYEYLYDELKKMYEYGLIKINCDFDKFIFNKPLKSKDYHHSIQYNNIIVDNQTIFEPKIYPVKLDDHLELR